MLRLAVVLALALLLAVADDAPFEPSLAHTPTTKVTWGQDVQPILERRCVSCHRRDGLASTSLETYSDAKAMAADIRREILGTTMPPWPAARGIADYTNDQRLTEIEMTVLVGWTSGGTPLGAPVQRSAPKIHHGADLTLTGSNDSQARDRYVFSTTDTRERWISAWRFDAGGENPSVSVTLTIEGTPLGRWVPGDGLVALPPNVGVRLPRRARILVDLDRGKSSAQRAGSSTMPTIELFWRDRPEQEVTERVFPCGTTELKRALDVIGVRPEASAAGVAIAVSATQPNGAVVPLALIPRYTPRYRPMLRLRRPVSISAGGRLRIDSTAPDCRATFELAERR